MLSRLFWISIAGLALIAGIAVQDGGRIFSWDDHDEFSANTEKTVEHQVDRAIERSFDKMQVVGSDGEEIDVPATTKRAMADAVGRLVKAEADLAAARFGEENDDELRAASARRDQARADVERLKSEIEAFEKAASSDNEAMREQIRREIREDVRDTVRDAVGS